MYDAWQAQQKAQKDQERKAKTDAATALQGYRRSGLSEEETKLAALREQERLQKLNAEQQLRGYRSQLTAEEAKLAAQKQDELRKKQEHEEQLRKVSSNDPKAHHNLMENSGMVSALAAGYTSPNKAQPSTPAVPKTSPPQPDFSLAMTSDHSAVVATNAISEPFVENKSDIGPVTPVANAQLDLTPTAAPAAGAARGEGLRGSVEASEFAPSTTTTTDSDPVTLAPAVPSSTIAHSSVNFMFGILTAGDVSVSFPEIRSQLVEGYLARADQIAKSVITDNNSSYSSFESILLSMAYPTAASVKKDDSRTDANRIMATVTISFSAPDQATARDFQSQVIGRVRDAISAGTFTKVDR